MPIWAQDYSGPPTGEPKLFDLRFLDVWVKRDGRWQIVARQSAYKVPAK
jgi:hypothetical protein